MLSKLSSTYASAAEYLYTQCYGAAEKAHERGQFSALALYQVLRPPRFPLCQYK